MTIGAIECRKFANACLDLTEKALPSEKAILHEMAEVCLDLAASALEKERIAGPNAPFTETAP